MAEDQIEQKLKVMVFGGSSGSLEVLLKLLPGLTEVKYAIVIVLHRMNSEDSTLESLIAVRTTIPVQVVEDKTELIRGSIYIAPADYHLLFEKNNRLSLDHSEKVNYSRPSIDVTFESAADAYGKNVTAILLSGANGDGTIGLQAIKSCGGTVIVQDPATAQMPFMPNHAIENVEVDYVLTIDEIATFLSAFSQ